MPKPQPLAMPAQDFDAPAVAPSPAGGPAIRNRLLVLVGAVALTLAFAVQLYFIVSFVRLTPLLALFLVLSTMAFAWVALGAMISALGLGLLLSGSRGPVQLPAPRRLRTRSALLFPVYHESPAQVAGTVQALSLELAKSEHAKSFDVFVLSDSQTADAIEEETRIYRELAQRLRGVLSIYYRRRADNVGKKSGNIQEWIERFGGGYDHFVILDADSIMSADLIVRLAAAMEDNPKLGLVQTPPALVNGTTRLQLLQQFAHGVYGPVAAAGLAGFCGRDGNYWGHNAIIRTHAFAAAAGLPELPGRVPFGGHIRSHDFVEACLLLRAGWAVVMTPSARGSYEGCPPDLITFATRMRRWAQGNLQHLAVLPRAGLTGMGRMHLAMGAASYLAAVVWLAALLTGLVVALGGVELPSYFGQQRTLFPQWPRIDPDAALRLFVATGIVVLLPKLLGTAWLMRGMPLASWRQRARVVGGVVLETLLSTLIAPLLMLVETRSVIEVLWGRDSGWLNQPRTGAGPTMRAALRFNALGTAVGVSILLATAASSDELVLWAAPVWLGLLLSAPMTWWSARPAGRLMQAALTHPAQTDAPVVVQARRLSSVWERRLKRSG